jgi:hypothetical protein
MLSGERANVSRPIFPLSGVGADDRSDDVVFTSGGCTTLPSLQVIVIQLDIVVTFFGVAVKEPVELIEVYLALFTAHTYDIHVTP